MVVVCLVVFVVCLVVCLFVFVDYFGCFFVGRVGFLLSWVFSSLILKP